LAKAFPPNYAAKDSIVRELFINTADDNYVTARLCFINVLNVDFLWLAVHTIEKFLKASLLLNGYSSIGPANSRKEYRHDITRLYETLVSFASDLLPLTLNCPSQLDILWHNESPTEFLRRLYDDGNADNRYQIFGYVIRSEYLHKLDQIVFAVRRLCQPLDLHFLGRNVPDAPDRSKRDLLVSDPTMGLSMHGRLEDIMRGAKGNELQHAALNCNFSFASATYPHTAIPNRSSAQNPVLARRILDPLEGPRTSEEVANLIDLCEWVLGNIHLPRDVRGQIESAKAEYLKKV
jgi:hypothetical protein